MKMWMEINVSPSLRRSMMIRCVLGVDEIPPWPLMISLRQVRMRVVCVIHSGFIERNICSSMMNSVRIEEMKLFFFCNV